MIVTIDGRNKTYDLCDGSLSMEPNEDTGHYSAEALLVDIEEIAKDHTGGPVIIWGLHV